MKLNFCTLFDSGYLTRGLVMYESLLRYSSDFHLFIYAFDDKACQVLKKMSLKHATVISLQEFEDADLLRVKPSRSVAEYCWTCTSSTILYSINKFALDNCTYVDADICFYSDPKALIDEMKDSSVLITEHRYTPEYDQTLESGKYCVQFTTFRNDERGMKALSWWRNECIKWCYARSEDGKFGDQKYLDDWTTRFSGVHELQHIGGGVAPWNLQQYSFSMKGNSIYLRKEESADKVGLVFFHFHHLKFYLNNIVRTTSNYLISDWVIRQIYAPYIAAQVNMKGRVQAIDASFEPNGARGDSPGRPFSFRDKLHLYKEAALRLDIGGLMGVSKKIRLHNYFALSKFV